MGWAREVQQAVVAEGPEGCSGAEEVTAGLKALAEDFDCFDCFDCFRLGADCSLVVDFIAAWEIGWLEIDFCSCSDFCFGVLKFLVCHQSRQNHHRLCPLS